MEPTNNFVKISAGLALVAAGIAAIFVLNRPTTKTNNVAQENFQQQKNYSIGLHSPALPSINQNKITQLNPDPSDEQSDYDDDDILYASSSSNSLHINNTNTHTKISNINTHITPIENLSSIPVENDGNCLFESARIALINLKKSPPQTNLGLRRSCVDWLRENANKPNVHKALNNALSDLKARRKKENKDELSSLEWIKTLPDANEQDIEKSFQKLTESSTKIDNMSIYDYLQELGKDKFFGGEAVMLAISELYQVKVVVKHVFGNSNQGEQIVAGDKFSDTLNLQRDIGQNHYDALIHNR